MKRIELLEGRLLLSAVPLVVEGFDAEQYAVGSQLDGSSPVVSGFDGIWAGSGSASIESGSLSYAGLGASGSNHVQLNDSITVSRQFDVTAGAPLENYIDANGDIGTSLDGSALYLSFLMQVGGTTPPSSTFSLYNNGTTSTDREFRILHSSSNTAFQAITGPSGTAANLDPLNSTVNLFVIKIEFAAGNDTIRVWQNPVAGDPEPAAEAVFTNYDIAFDRLAFTRFTGTGTAQFDEVRIGTQWSAVTDVDALNLVLRPPISVDGFNDADYVSGDYVDGVWSYIPVLDGTWSSVGSSATIEAGSLNYAGYVPADTCMLR